MSSIEDNIVLENIQELRRILRSTDGKLVKSKISPQDFFVNLSHDAPALKYPEVGISKIIVNICELISTLLLDEGDSTSRTIVMIFEYYFLVSPILFKSQGARFVNDLTFMKQFAQYIKSLCKSGAQAQKELGNALVSLELFNPIKDIDT